MNLKNKKVLIIGVASKRSIAAAIANTFSINGADILLTYQNEKLKSRVEEIAAELDNKAITYPCDLASDTQITSLKDHIEEIWSNVDIIIHSAAFAPRELLTGTMLRILPEKVLKLLMILVLTPLLA